MLVTAVAMAAWTIMNGSYSAPLGIKITLTNDEKAIAGIRKMGRVAHAASGITAHSRYQGCTTGKSRTIAPSETPSAPTGWIRPTRTAISMRTVMKAAISDAIGRVRLSTAVVWSPRPSRTPARPVPSPSNVGIDIQLRTSVAVPSVWVQPMPSPLATLTNTVTAMVTAPRMAAADTSALRLPPHRRARAMPTKPSASSDGILIVEDNTISVAPASRRSRTRPRIGWTLSTARRATSTPASIRPIMRASLWMPATRWNSTSGFAAPSHNALTAETPQRRARRGSAHTISATPASARMRCRKIPATMLSPVR